MRKLILAGFFIYMSHQVLAADMSGLAATVDAVLSHNAGLHAAQAQVRQSQAGLSEARAMRLPQLSGRSQFTRGDHPVYVFGSLMEQGRFGPQNFAIDALNHPGDLTNIQSALDLGIPLFTGFEVTSAIRMNELSLQQSQSQQDGASQQLRLQGATLYLQLLLDSSLLQSLEERLTTSQNEVEDARRLKERGLVLGSDYFAAEAILQGLKAWKIQVQTDQAATAARLALLAGKERITPQGSLTDKAYTLPTEADLIKAALVQRPDLSAAASQVTLAEVNRRQAGRSLLPKVQAFATLETDTNDFSSNPSNHLYGVAAHLPFGDPGYLARRAKAASGEEMAQRSKENLEESIRIDVSQAYEAYQGALANLPVTQEMLARSAKSLELFRPLYRSGRQSIMEVLRAEEGLAKTQSAYSQALFHLHSGYVQLMAAAGGLNDKVIQDLSQHLEAQP